MAPGSWPKMRKISSDHPIRPLVISQSQLPRWAMAWARARLSSLARRAASASRRAVVSNWSARNFVGQPSRSSRGAMVVSTQ